MKRVFFRHALLLITLPALSGCVAALVPLAAGGAIIGKDRINPKETDQQEKVIEPVEPSTPASAQPEIIDEPAPMAAVTELPMVKAAVQEVAESPSNKIIEVAPNPTTDTAEATATSGQTAPIGPTDFRAYDVLYNYVDLQSRRDPTKNPLQSALLAAPGTLSPVRTGCSIRPPSVLFDLDPRDAIFDPSITPLSNPALMQMLASLRAQDIDVFWTSRLAAVRAGDVRKALINSGMDTQGRDGLLLMRSAEDRKQTRRKELGETHCLIAIAGDRRADFDELYLYLKDRSAAQSLEELIGAGWFLTPLPLSEGQSQ